MTFIQPGTTLSTMDVGGETHVDGWSFSLPVGQLNNDLFQITDNLLQALAYVPPGKKTAQVKADKVGSDSASLIN